MGKFLTEAQIDIYFKSYYELIKMSNQLDASVAKRLDITVKQNQTFNATITVLDDAGVAINLTGADVKMSVRQQTCGGGGCYDFAFDSFDLVYKQDFVPTITGGSMNVLEFFDVVKLTDGIYKYDLLVEYPSTLKQYILTGTFKVKKSYTSI